MRKAPNIPKMITYNFLKRSKKISVGELRDIHSLMARMTHNRNSVNRDRLTRALRNPYNHILVARDSGKIVGMGTLHVRELLSGGKSTIEDVVVDRYYEGRGIGRAIMNRLRARAEQLRHLKIKSIDLTSKPSRASANALYGKLGYKKINTNYRRLTLGKK